jgi:AcrR family transcriptional regulator
VSLKAAISRQKELVFKRRERCPYKHFEDKEDCFAQAYHDAANWLYRRLVGVAKRQPTWRQGLRAGTAGLLEFCANQQALARALLVEAHAAGGAALAEHDLLMERLSRAIDGARREIPSRQAPPPVTATFMVGAIEFGEDAAWEEMTAAPLATWKTRREAATRMP